MAVDKNYFRLFGVLTLLVVAVADLAYLAASRLSDPSSYPSARMMVIFIVLTVLGIGLVCLRKWAALYFSIPLFIYGVWVAWTSISTVPFPLNLFCMCDGISLMLPLIVTIRIWPQLTWRGKWIF